MPPLTDITILQGIASQLTVDQLNQLEDLIENKKLQAIKEIRGWTGAGLKESKDLVESLWFVHGVKDDTLRTWPVAASTPTPVGRPALPDLVQAADHAVREVIAKLREMDELAILALSAADKFELRDSIDTLRGVVYVLDHDYNAIIDR